MTVPRSAGKRKHPVNTNTTAPNEKKQRGTASNREATQELRALTIARGPHNAAALRMANALIARGANVNAAGIAYSNGVSLSLLSSAIIKGHTALALKLIDAGAIVNDAPGTKTPLMLACSASSGNTAIVKKLLAAGAETDVSHVPYGYRNKTLTTPLLEAVRNGFAETVELLLAAGASPEYPSFDPHRQENCPLVVAASLGRPRIVAALLRAGATHRVNALLAAVRKRHRDIASLLLSSGLGVLSVADNADVRRAMHWARDWGLDGILNHAPNRSNAGKAFNGNKAHVYMRERKNYKNVPSPNIANATNTVGPFVPLALSPKFDPALLQQLKARSTSFHAIGNGKNGAAYAFRGIKPGFMNALIHSRGASVRAEPHKPWASSTVVLKVLDDAVDTQELASEFTSEVETMRHLGSAPPVAIGSRLFYAAKYVPTLYLSGFAGGKRVILMSEAPGDTLPYHGSLPAQTIATLEHAVLSLWLAGVSHADLNPGNFLFTAAGRVTLIDFGRSVRLPRSVVTRIKSRLIEFASSPRRVRDGQLRRSDVLHLLFDSVLTPATNARFRHTHWLWDQIPAYFTNTAMVADVVRTSCHAPSCSKDIMAAERLKKWVP